VSDTILKIISTIPAYVPNDAQLERTKNLLSKYYNPACVEFEVTDSIEFIDQGSNFETVSCNICGQEISAGEWQDQMNKAFEVEFRDLSFQTSCQHQTSLNDLNYSWPAGFARFSIRISNPQNEFDENLEQLKEILGTEVRIIWAHY
jgi:transcription elongation factor Elf1